jgi:hypothetical protein
MVLWVVEVTTSAREGVGMEPRRHKPRDVRDIHHEVGPDLAGDLAEGGKVDDARVRGSAGDDHTRFVLFRQRPDAVVVYEARFGVAAVGDGFEKLTGKTGGTAVRKVAALVQIHTHHGIAGLTKREVDAKFAWSRVGLNIGIFCTEDLAGALNGDLLHDVHTLAASVIAVAGVTFRVLVGEYAARGAENGPR